MAPQPHVSYYKTRWCDFYYRSHGCRYGARCRHAHHGDELRSVGPKASGKGRPAADVAADATDEFSSYEFDAAGPPPADSLPQSWRGRGGWVWMEGYQWLPADADGTAADADPWATRRKSAQGRRFVAKPRPPGANRKTRIKWRDADPRADAVYRQIAGWAPEIEDEADLADEGVMYALEDLADEVADAPPPPPPRDSDAASGSAPLVHGAAAMVLASGPSPWATRITAWNASSRADAGDRAGADGPDREPPRVAADGADRTGVCVDDTGADGAHRRGTGTWDDPIWVPPGDPWDPNPPVRHRQLDVESDGDTVASW